MDPTLKVAKKYPKIDFEHATGFKSAPNMGTYSGRFYEGRYIQGVIAAKMSKTGVLGYIASFPIPEVISGINATMLGAQSVNPNIKVKIIWVNTWFDPGQGSRRRQGAGRSGRRRASCSTPTSPAAMQIAAQRGILAFGQDCDMIKFGPKTQLTAIIDNWAPYYIEQVKAVLDGTWKSERHLGRPEVEDGGDGALHQHARRREGAGRKDRSGDRRRQRCIRSSAR